MAWSIEGTYIEACNCEVACPCIFLSPPTEGECKVVVGWHIDKGHHGDAVLDGLNAALIAYAPGNMKDDQWTVALYLDDRGDDQQSSQFSCGAGWRLCDAQILAARASMVAHRCGDRRPVRSDVWEPLLAREGASLCARRNSRYFGVQANAVVTRAIFSASGPHLSPFSSRKVAPIFGFARVSTRSATCENQGRCPRI